VRQALVDRYHIAAARLSPSGYGESRPKETNDTIEGRARNRRVELAKQ
jgi:OOP family OmpA-OmpF porin